MMYHLTHSDDFLRYLTLLRKKNLEKTQKKIFSGRKIKT